MAENSDGWGFIAPRPKRFPLSDDVAPHNNRIGAMPEYRFEGTSAYPSCGQLVEAVSVFQWPSFRALRRRKLTGICIESNATVCILPGLLLKPLFDSATDGIEPVT